MLWHLTKRELFEQLISLRFCFATIITVSLMVVNAVGHIEESKVQQAVYRQNVSRELQEMKDRCDNFYNLVEAGPGQLYKKPSKLSFFANGSENHLPQTVRAGWAQGVSGLWRLSYNTQPGLTTADIFPTFLKIDWVFIFTFVFSLLALIFSYDAISGDAESGTLRLMLSNAVARRKVLNAKFLSAFISLGVLFIMCGLMNLLVLHLSGTLQLNTEECGRIAGIFLVVFLYLALFIALGLLVSSCTDSTASSMILLLLLWTVWVLLVPSTLGSVVSHLNRAPPQHSGRSPNPFRNEIGPRYVARGLLEESPSRARPPTPATLLWAEFLNEEARTAERLNRELLRAQIREIQVSKNFEFISPASIAKSAVEVLAGTGLQRHLQFLKDVDNYAVEFNDFLIATDRDDPESPHVPFVKEGMSNKPVSFERIPKFEDKVRLEDAFKGATLEIVLLFLFFAVLFVAAHVSFQHKEV